MRVLVLALGNPILCDDGVAFHVVERMRHRLPEFDDLVFEEACTGGIDLLVYIMDFDRVLILDAVLTRKDPPGTVGVFRVDQLGESIHMDSPHHTNFATAIELGKKLHADRMPGDIQIIGVEVDNIKDFTEELTEPVEASVPKASEKALEILRGWGVPSA
ncbi:MAG: hydrogenase maturation protease [Candidatus Thermoplasmatota archaeon]|nr:hydrogenase maturation protease [Candidatus Thermoplasmatota archaeon]